MDHGQDIPFTFEHGVLRPDGKVDLPEGARGVARIVRRAWTVADGERAMESIRRIAAQGVLRSGGERVSRDQMHERG